MAEFRLDDLIAQAIKNREMASAGAEAAYGTMQADLQRPTDFTGVVDIPQAPSFMQLLAPALLANTASAVSGNNRYQEQNAQRVQQEDAKITRAKELLANLKSDDYRTRIQAGLHLKSIKLGNMYENAIQAGQTEKALELLDQHTKINKEIAAEAEKNQNTRLHDQISSAEGMQRERLKAEWEQLQERGKQDKEVAGIRTSKYGSPERDRLMGGFDMLDNLQARIAESAKAFKTKDTAKLFKKAPELKRIHDYVLGEVAGLKHEGETSQQFANRVFLLTGDKNKTRTLTELAFPGEKDEALAPGAANPAPAIVPPAEQSKRTAAGPSRAAQAAELTANKLGLTGLYSTAGKNAALGLGGFNDAMGMLDNISIANLLPFLFANTPADTTKR